MTRRRVLSNDHQTPVWPLDESEDTIGPPSRRGELHGRLVVPPVGTGDASLPSGTPRRVAHVGLSDGKSHSRRLWPSLEGWDPPREGQSLQSPVGKSSWHVPLYGRFLDKKGDPCPNSPERWNDFYRSLIRWRESKQIRSGVITGRSKGFRDCPRQVPRSRRVRDRSVSAGGRMSLVDWDSTNIFRYRKVSFPTPLLLMTQDGWEVQIGIYGYD